MSKNTTANVRILRYIPYGKENAISRKELCEKTGLGDRTVRELINKERESAVIINVQDGKGYYRPNEKDVDDVQRFYDQELKRSKNIFRNLRPVRKFLMNFGTL